MSQVEQAKKGQFTTSIFPQNNSNQHHILLWLSSKEYTCNTHVPHHRWYDWHHSVVVAPLLLCDHRMKPKRVELSHPE